MKRIICGILLFSMVITLFAQNQEEINKTMKKAAAMLQKLQEAEGKKKKFTWQKNIVLDRKMLDETFEMMAELYQIKHNAEVVKRYNEMKKVMLILSIKRSIEENTRHYIRTKLRRLSKTRLDKESLKALENFSDIKYKRGLIDYLVRLPKDMANKPSFRERVLRSRATDRSLSRQDAIVLSPFILLYKLKRNGMDKAEQARIKEALEEIRRTDDPRKKLKRIMDLDSKSELDKLVESLIRFEIRQEKIDADLKKARMRHDIPQMAVLKQAQIKLDMEMGKMYLELLEFVENAVNQNLRDTVMPNIVKQRLYQNMFWSVLEGLNLQKTRRRNYRRLLRTMTNTGQLAREHRLKNWLENSGYQYAPKYLKIRNIYIKRVDTYEDVAAPSDLKGRTAYVEYLNKYYPVSQIYVKDGNGRFVTVKNEAKNLLGNYTRIPEHYSLRKQLSSGRWVTVEYFNAEKTLKKWREK